MPSSDYLTISITDPGGNSGRNYKLFGCARRGCDSINCDWWAYEGKDGKSYCLHHRPLRDRIVSWYRESKRLFLERHGDRLLGSANCSHGVRLYHRCNRCRPSEEAT